MKWALRILLAAFALTGMAALSRVPFDTDRDEHALVRFSWRTRGKAEEHCRNRTQAELDALPIHMRTPQVCSGRIASYELDFEIDEQHIVRRTFRAAGAHADRPIYVLEEIPIPPGAHHIEAEFYSTAHPHDQRLKYEKDVTVEGGDILLITYDDERGALYLRRE